MINRIRVLNTLSYFTHKEREFYEEKITDNNNYIFNFIYNIKK